MHKKVNSNSFRQFQLNSKGLTNSFAINVSTNNQEYLFKENLYITFWLQNEIKRMKFLPLKIEIQKTQKLEPKVKINIVIFNRIIFKIYFLYRFFKRLIITFFKRKLFFLHLKRLNRFLRIRKLKRRKISYKKNGIFIWTRTIRLVQRRNTVWNQIFQKITIFLKNYRRIFLSLLFFLKTVFFSTNVKQLFLQNDFFVYYFFNSIFLIKNQFNKKLITKKKLTSFFLINSRIFLTLIRQHLSALFTTRLIKLKSLIELHMRSQLKVDADINLFVIQSNNVIAPQLNIKNTNRMVNVKKKKYYPFLKNNKNFYKLIENSQQSKKEIKSLDNVKKTFFFFQKKMSFLKNSYLKHILQITYDNIPKKFYLNKSNIIFVMAKSFLRKQLFLLFSKSNNKPYYRGKFQLEKKNFRATYPLSYKSDIAHTYTKSFMDKIIFYKRKSNFIFSQTINIYNYRTYLKHAFLAFESNNNNMLRITLSHKNPKKYGRKFDYFSYHRYLTFKAKGFIFLRNHVKLMVYGICTGNIDIFNEAFCRSFKKIKKHRAFFDNLQVKLNDMFYVANIRSSLVGMHIRIRGKHDKKERRSTYWIQIGQPLKGPNPNHPILYNFTPITTKIGVFGVSTWFIFDNSGNAYPYANKI